MPGYAARIDTGHAVETPLWRALQAADQPRSVAELHILCRAHPNSIQHRLTRWVKAGLVIRLEGRPKRFAMNDITEPTSMPPRVTIAGQVRHRRRTARERLWSAMRVLKRFDLPQLMMSAAASRRSTEDYVNCLQRAGYLRMERRGNPMTGEWSRYALVRNSGPRSPRVSRRVVGSAPRREVVDPNTGGRHDISPGAVRLHSNAQADDRGVS